MGKAKLALGIILFVIGAGILPTGYVLHNSIENQLDAAIPQTLFSIRDQFLPEAGEMIKFEAIAPSFIGIKDELTPQIPYLLNGSVTANAINQTIDGLAGSVGYPVAINMFFNDPLWSITTGGAFPINSISEVMGQPLGFTANGQNNTLFGTGNWPGIISDLEQGSGIYAYLQAYQNALAHSSEATMATAYNATWDQISNVTAYLSSYMFPLVPTLGSLPFAADNSTAETYFYFQWANASLVNEGIPLPIGSGVEAWEIGVTYASETATYRPSNFSLPLTIALWDVSDTLSPFNYDDGGFHLWYAATSNSTLASNLQSHFSMSSIEFNLFVSYLFDADMRDRVIIPLVEADQGLIFDNVVLAAFYAQWSNGLLIPEGISSLGPQYSVLEGIEVVLPPETFNIGNNAPNLWDPNNSLSLTHPDGIQDWLIMARLDPGDDIGDTIQFAQMNEEFSMNEGRVETLSEWVLRFRNEILPILAWQSGVFFMHPTEFADILNITGLIGGGFLAFLGIIVILSYRKR